ncbi:hypothetical protein Tco_0794490 [Tanacetum coccineum]
MSENEDRYHDTVLDLDAKLKKNVDLILKLGNSLQGMFMLGPKPLFVYDQQLKHGLGYLNPYTLKQAISQCPKLYLASSLGNSEISLNIRDTDATLDDASKMTRPGYPYSAATQFGGVTDWYQSQVMSVDSAVTYTSVHSEARSWSIPSEDPYEEVARQLLEQAPTPPLPPSFLSPRIRPPHTRAAMRQMRATAPSTYHSLLPSGTPPLLPIPLPAPSTSRRADIPEADTPPRKRLLLTTPRPGCEVGESSAAAVARQPGPTIARVLRRERLNNEQESIQTRETLARSEAHCRTLEARITVLETEARHHEWQRQDADDHAVEHIMRTQALEARARMDTLEDTGSSS